MRGLKHGVDDYPYLQPTLDTLDNEIQVAPTSDTVANREAVVSDHLDPGEAEAFALADAEEVVYRLTTGMPDHLRKIKL